MNQQKIEMLCRMENCGRFRLDTWTMLPSNPIIPIPKRQEESKGCKVNAPDAVPPYEYVEDR
jgi:hypothetical protein